MKQLTKPSLLLLILCLFSTGMAQASTVGACPLKIEIAELSLDQEVESVGYEQNVAKCAFIVLESTRESKKSIGQLSIFQGKDGDKQTALGSFYDFCVEEARRVEECRAF